MPLLEKPITIEQWKRSHGDFVIVFPSTYLFKDGARLEYSDVNRGYSFLEPSEQPAERLCAVKKYYMEKIKQAENAFQNLQASELDQERLHAGHPMGCPSSDPSAPAVLARMRDEIYRLRDELADVDRELDTMPDAVARRLFEEDRNQRAAASRERTAALLSVHLNGAAPRAKPADPQVEQIIDGYKQVNKVLEAIAAKPEPTTTPRKGKKL